MDEARSEDTWNHTASLMSMIANSFAGAETTFEDFHPHHNGDLDAPDDVIDYLENNGL